MQLLGTTGSPYADVLTPTRHPEDAGNHSPTDKLIRLVSLQAHEEGFVLMREVDGEVVANLNKECVVHG
jgi:hypothetical protein